MKIAILGTRGIPNNYGGFEQCAEKIATKFKDLGHEVTVYNPKDHPYKGDLFKGVKIHKIYSNETKLSHLNVFLFDLLSMLHAVTRKYDVILQLGYHPSALYFCLAKFFNVKLVTNMAGIEWQRSKWGFFATNLIKLCEFLAVKLSDEIVSDNQGIKEYYIKKYKVDSTLIEYGAEINDHVVETVLQQFNVESGEYYMLMARFQPDNNIDLILDGFVSSKSERKFLVVGDYNNSYGKYLLNRYAGCKDIVFVGGVYDYKIISSLRYFSKIYFHGHSAGGTNPSLLEAMASKSYIVAYDNIYNRNVLKEGGLYFKNSNEVHDIILSSDLEEVDSCARESNLNAIKNYYNWDLISQRYLDMFEQVISVSSK